MSYCSLQKIMILHFAINALLSLGYLSKFSIVQVHVFCILTKTKNKTGMKKKIGQKHCCH